MMLGPVVPLTLLGTAWPGRQTAQTLVMLG